MNINRLVLTNFRNYENLDLSFNNERNIIIGDNAQGKTNLIEAIYIAAFSRSFRTNNAADLVKFNTDMARIIVEFNSEDIDRNLRIDISNNGKKMIMLDGQILRRAQDLLSHIVVISFTPDDLRIIKDQPDKRRSFINKEICQLKPGYYEALKLYNEALKQKNSLLKENSVDHGIIDLFDEQLSINAYKIIRYRHQFINLLSAKASEIQSNISKFKDTLDIKYSSSIHGNSIDSIKEELLNNRNRDVQMKTCTIGPHRDDIIFYINGRDARKFASQGQQRTIALSIKLAEVSIAKSILGENPILVMDDVLSELDIDRQRFLINEIDDLQLFITSTEIHNDIDLIQDGVNIFTIDNGSAIKK